MSPALTRLASSADAARIAEIYNQGILDRSSTFETRLRTEEEMALRIGEDPGRYPVLVLEEAGRVVGWAGLTSYRPRPCYAGVAEFSVYLDRACRGRGLGKALLQELVAAAASRGYWKVVSRVFPFNAASLALCRACGFREVGVYLRHGKLDGRWLDVVIVERLIPENQSSP
jgi:L-amino acid N-acyltransferase YncA